MTWQSLSCWAQLPRASLTALCSPAAWSANPGRPEVPTATALHPDNASASLRATSSLASAAIEAFLSARKKPVTLEVVGSGTMKLSSMATIMQATPASAPQRFFFILGDQPAVASNIGRENRVDLA